MISPGRTDDMSVIILLPAASNNSCTPTIIDDHGELVFFS